MRIWLDMANSPHPVLLAPVAQDLEARGHTLIVTGRDHAQTRELTLRTWPKAVIVGGESPGGRLAKAAAVGQRVIALRRAVQADRPQVAVSLGSYAQILAARSLGARVLTMMDYEHQPANHLSFRLADRVVIPDAFPAERLRHYGARSGRVRRFTGFKEEMYLDCVDGEDPPIEAAPGKALVVFRPPPEGALYHQHGNATFYRLLQEAAARADVEVVVLPRFGQQRKRFSYMKGVRVPDRAVDGLALLSAADVFIGAGGTMCREAALLGARSYTVFAGRPSAVDRQLIADGRLSDLRENSAVPVDFSRHPDRPRGASPAGMLSERSKRLRLWLVEQIEALA